MINDSKLKKIFYLLILLTICFIGFSVRFFWHEISPPGFTADEAVFGYNAYSLLKTGKDEFGVSWPVAFRAFGDWRPALYSYLAIPFIYIFGLTELAVRMPSILLGTATIPVVMGMTWILTKSKVAPAAAGLILALSPAHILISRFADMSTLSTFFLGTGITLFLWWRQQNRPAVLASSAVSIVLAVYSYHNARLTGPLVLLILSILNFNLIRRKLNHVFIAFILGIITLLPLLIFIVKSPELSLRRGRYESFLAQKGYEIRLWNLVSSNPPQQNPLITRFFHNKPKIIFQELSERYLSHFSPGYLFWFGDPHERFQTPKSGIYNLSLFVLLPVGFLVGLRNRHMTVLPAWWLVSPLVASLGLFAPNSLHTLDSVVPVAVMSGIGLEKLIGKFTGELGIVIHGAIVLIFVSSVWLFIDGYFSTIPADLNLRWNWYPQTRELTSEINRLTGSYKVIIVGNRSLHQFVLFNNAIDPTAYQHLAVVSQVPDENGFERVERFGRFEFFGEFNKASISGTDWVVFDRDSLPTNMIWQAKDCVSNKDKPFFELKTQIEDLEQPVYSIYYFPKDQLRSKSGFCTLNSNNL